MYVKVCQRVVLSQNKTKAYKLKYILYLHVKRNFQSLLMRIN